MLYIGQPGHPTGQVLFASHLPRDKFCQKYLSDPAVVSLKEKCKAIHTKQSYLLLIWSTINTLGINSTSPPQGVFIFKRVQFIHLPTSEIGMIIMFAALYACIDDIPLPHCSCFSQSILSVFWPRGQGHQQWQEGKHQPDKGSNNNMIILSKCHCLIINKY